MGRLHSFTIINWTFIKRRDPWEQTTIWGWLQQREQPLPRKKTTKYRLATSILGGGNLHNRPLDDFTVLLLIP